MSTSMLVIGGSGKLESLCIAAYPSEEVQLVFASDIGSAKRCLVKKTPAVIICSDQVVGGADAIIELSEQLKEHPVFSQVPFLVVTSGDGSVYGNVKGIKGIINPALSPEDFVKRVQNVIRGIITKESSEVKPTATSISSDTNSLKDAAPVKKGGLSTNEDLLAATSVGQSKTAIEAKDLTADGKSLGTGDVSEVAAKSKEAKESSMVFDEDFLKKINLAQRILAKVFVNLKSSSLLQIVELEDVPRVVFEITRTVCGVPSNEPAERTQKRQEQSEHDTRRETNHDTVHETGVDLNFDKVFKTK